MATKEEAKEKLKQLIQLDYDYYKTLFIAMFAANFVVCFGLINNLQYLSENNVPALIIFFILGLFLIAFMIAYFYRMCLCYNQLREIIEKSLN